MTPEQYEARLKMIREERENQEIKLAKEYAFGNNTIKVGDIVEDHCSSIEVEVIKFTRSISLPCCVYEGKELTRKLVPRKDGARRTVYQSNIKKVHNVTT